MCVCVFWMWGKGLHAFICGIYFSGSKLYKNSQKSMCSQGQCCECFSCRHLYLTLCHWTRFCICFWSQNTPTIRQYGKLQQHLSLPIQLSLLQNIPTIRQYNKSEVFCCTYPVMAVLQICFVLAFHAQPVCIYISCMANMHLHFFFYSKVHIFCYNRIRDWLGARFQFCQQ